MRTSIAIVAFAALAGIGAFFALSPTHAQEMSEAEIICAMSNGTMETRGNMAFCIIDRHELAPFFKSKPLKDVTNTTKSLEKSRA